MSNVFRERGFCPESVVTEPPLRGGVTSDYFSRYPSPAWMLCGEPIAVELFDSQGEVAPILLVAIEPQFLGYWLIGPLMPLPLIPAFGIASERETQQFVVHLWAPAGSAVGIDLSASFVTIGEAPQRVASASWERHETRWEPAPAGSKTQRTTAEWSDGVVSDPCVIWVPPLVIENGREWRENRVTAFFPAPAAGAKSASLDLVVELESGQQVPVHIRLEKRTAWVFDAVGVGGRRQYD